MKKATFLFLMLVALPLWTLFAQANKRDTKADSLLVLIKKDTRDTTKARHLNELAETFLFQNPDTAQAFAREALKIITPISSVEFPANGTPAERGVALLKAKSLGLIGIAYNLKADYANSLEYYFQALQIDIATDYKKGIAARYSNIANVYSDMGDYKEALVFANKSLQIEEENKNKEGIAGSLGTIGTLYLYQSAFPQALDNFLKTLKIAEEINNKRYIANSLSNIGMVYRYQENYSKALDYYFQGLKIFETLNDKSGINISLGQIGVIYKNLKDYPKALEYYSKAIKVAGELGNESDVAAWLGASAVVFEQQHNFAKAEECYFKALKMAEKKGDKSSILINLGNIGSYYVNIGKFNDAEKYLVKSQKLAIEIGDNEFLQKIEQNLSELYDTIGRHKEAFIHYKKAAELKDTLYNREKQELLVKREMNYQFEKKEAEIQAAHDKQMAVAEAERKKQRVIIYFVLAGLFLVALFAAFVFYTLKVTRKQKSIIENQKGIVSNQKEIVEKQKEKIVDSINYALGIQQSILPEEVEIKKYLPDSFIFYKPKDIVSGDFYWFSQKNEKLIIAAVDCTGHGVPGAFMSMIGNTLLNQIIIENECTVPSQILEQLDKGINKALHQDGEGILSLDGMDISLCSIDYSKNEIQFAGAHNPMYVVVNGEIELIKSSPIGIGGNSKTLKMLSSEEIKFVDYSIPIKENMIIYLFSDGYADQFREGDKKKFGKQNFQNLLLDISRFDIEDQKNAIAKSHEEWKGKLEQIDDILVMGIKIK